MIAALSQISAFMSSPVNVVHPSDTLTHTRNIMLHHKINRLIVIDDSTRPVGVLTRVDVAREVSRRSPQPGETFDDALVREVMTSSPVSLKPTDSVILAARTMLRHGISGIPIVDEENTLAGIVSKTDLTRYYGENCQGLVKLGEVETRVVSTIPSTYTLYRAEELMKKQKIGRLVVVKGKTPIGIITQRDLIFAKFSSGGPQDKFRRTRTEEDGSRLRTIRSPEEATVEEVMRSPLITIGENESVDQAARLMNEKGIGGIPVVNSSIELTGIITKTDVMKSLIIYEKRKASRS